MKKYNLVMTPTLCRVAVCIISIRPTYSCARALIYLHSSLCAYKTGNICETVEDRAKVTINRLYKVVHCLSIPPKCMTLNDLCARFKVIDALNGANMTKYSLVMTTTPRRVAGGISLLGLPPTYSWARALTYLLTQNNQCFWRLACDLVF